LVALDPVAAARIDRANVRRLVRALEVCLVTGRPFSEQQRAQSPGYNVLTLGLNMDRQALYARADARVHAMLAAGLVEEAAALVAAGYEWSLPSMSSLGYRELGAYLRGEATLDEAVARFKLDTHAYIRRQLSWFRSDTRIRWLDAALPVDALAGGVASIVSEWLGD
jgi:tRNA dimethylallyltransferase